MNQRQKERDKRKAEASRVRAVMFGRLMLEALLRGTAKRRAREAKAAKESK